MGERERGKNRGREREREALLKCWSFFFSLSPRFPHSHGSPPPPLPPPPPSLLPPPSCFKAPLVRALGSPTLPHPPSPPSLPFTPSACLPSPLPGRPGQRWRRSRDLQEICLSEKQLVRLSTANVCMLGPPPPPLPHGAATARPGTVGAPFSLISFHLQPVIQLSVHGRSVYSVNAALRVFQEPFLIRYGLTGDFWKEVILCHPPTFSSK